MEDTISIIIPCRNEPHLDRTVKDLLDKARGSIEIIVVLNGCNDDYTYTKFDGVKYITHEEPEGMRYAINAGAKEATGEYIMKIDAHCIVAPGFDEQLKKDHQPNWVQIPRRYKLDSEKWEPIFTDWIDYEYWIWPPRYPTTSLHGYKWHNRKDKRADVMIDDTLTFQGSFWFMTRKWWDECDFMNDDGYNQLHAQEATYLGNMTWFKGGRVVTNKNTWYAHWHKKRQDGRGYHMDDRKRRACYKYSYKHWVEDNKEFFINLIDKFWPLPNWPENWQDKLWKKK